MKKANNKVELNIPENIKIIKLGLGNAYNNPEGDRNGGICRGRNQMA
jgi:hypothetical protein